MRAYQEDIKIIALQKQFRRLTQSYDLDGRIWIGDTLCDPEPELLFDGKLQVYLPTHFSEPSEKSLKEKYPSVNRPQIIKTNEDETVDFTFNHISEKMMPITTKSLWEEVAGIFPRNVLYDSGTFTQGGLEVLWLEYKSFSLDLDVYNILFPILSEHAGTFIGTFTCPYKLYDTWKPCVLEIIKSIKIMEG